MSKFLKTSFSVIFLSVFWILVFKSGAERQNLSKSYACQQQKIQKEFFSKNKNFISTKVFEKIPAAQSVLIGPLYINKDTFTLFIRPTLINAKSIKLEDLNLYIKYDGLAIYKIEGKYINGIASISNIAPWHPEIKHEEERPFSFYDIPFYITKFVMFSCPGTSDFVSYAEKINNGFITMVTEEFPNDIYENNSIVSSANIVSGTVLSDVKFSAYKSYPIGLKTDKYILYAYPEFLKENEFIFNVTSLSCVSEKKCFKKGYILGQDGRINIKLEKENDYFIVRQNSKLDIVELN